MARREGEEVADIVTLGVEVQTKGAAQSAQQLGQFTTAAKGAAGAADTLENQLNATAAAQTKAVSTVRPLSGAMQDAEKAFQDSAAGAEKAGSALGNAVEQMAGGAAPADILADAVSEVASSFGPLGVVVGVAVGALLSFAPALFGASEEVKTLQETLEDLEDAFQKVQNASKAAREDLSGQYGAQAGVAREFLEIQRQIAEIEAERAFNTASVAVAEAMGGNLAGQTTASALENALLLNKTISERAALSEIAQQLERGELELTAEQTDALIARRLAQEENLDQLLQYRKGLENITAAFGISEQAAANLVIQMAAVLEAENTEARIAANTALAKAINDVTDGLSLSAEEGRVLTDQLLKAALAGVDFKSLDLPGTLGSAASNASVLADEMGRAASNAIAMAANASQARREAEIRLKFAGDPAGQAGAMFDLQSGILQGSQDMGVRMQFETLRQETVDNAAATAEAQAQLAAFNNTLRSSGTAAAKVDQEVAKLTETFDPFQKVVEGVAGTIESELNSAFASVLDGTKTLGEALLDFASNVLAQVAQDLFAQQFSKPIAAGIAGIFSEKGNVFNSAGVTPFANGGVVGGPTIFPFANGIGLMGEAGPEAIMPLARGADGKLGVTAANGNSAPNVIINNYSGQEATASSDSAGNLIVEIGRAIAQDITSGGPSYRAIRTTFGLGSRLQQRG